MVMRLVCIKLYLYRPWWPSCLEHVPNSRRHSLQGPGSNLARGNKYGRIYMVANTPTIIGRGLATNQERQSPTSQSSNMKLEMKDKMVQKNCIFEMVSNIHSNCQDPTLFGLTLIEATFYKCALSPF